MDRHSRYRGNQRTGRHERSRQSGFGAQVLGASLLMGIVVWNGAPALQSAAIVATTPREDVAKIEQSVYYSGCREARARGAAPIHRGSPGYRAEMDGDGDGIACEPYRGSDF